MSFIVQNVNNYFSQRSQSVTFGACNANYLERMEKSLPGMVMTTSLWGTGNGGMSWLDGESGCQETCDLSNSRVTSNIRVDDL